MILPGILASGISGHLLAAGNLVPLQTVTVGSGGASSVSFSSIPGTYTHLQIRAIHRQNLANTGADWLNLRFGNSGSIDSGSNYAYHYLYADASSVSAGANSSVTKILGSINNPSGNQPANTFGASVIDILDYANTNKTKVVRFMNGEANSGGTGDGLMFSSGLWNSTSAITDISIFNNTGTNAFVQYTQFALYGVK